MKIKIKTEGHQYFNETIGDVIKWCQTVERFNNVYLQVPAVIIKTGDKIKCVPLKQELYWSEIEVI